MKKTLSIYACSGIGANPNAEAQKYDYWLDNTNSVQNTQAVNSLLVRINTDAIELLYLDLTDEQVLERLNEIDWYASTMYFVQQYKDRAQELLQAKRAIGKAWDNGLFIYPEFDNQKRDLHLDEVIAKIEQYMDDSSLPEPSSAFADWWEAEIASKNKVGLSVEQQQRVQASLDKSGINGIGATAAPRKDLQAYLNEAGDYFLYTFATDEQIAQLPKEFKYKRERQRATYNYCKTLYVDVLGTEAQYREVIYSSVIKQLGNTPEKIISDAVITYNRDRSVAGIGITVEALIAILSAIVKIIELIGGILGYVAKITLAICEAVKASEVAEAESVTSEDIDKSIPHEEDFDDFDLEQYRKKGLSKKNILIIGAIALLALLRK